jgi:hypothetical protein
MGLEKGQNNHLYSFPATGPTTKIFFCSGLYVGNIAFQLSFHLFWNTIRWSKTFGKSKTIPTFKSPFLPLA